tara:strand:- start:378 stop:563 length:186 start_codon:yes stop_codon:yes gene_type:complete
MTQSVGAKVIQKITVGQNHLTKLSMVAVKETSGGFTSMGSQVMILYIIGVTHPVQRIALVK